MADGKYHLTKIKEIFDADVTLQALSAGGIGTHIGKFTPVGNTYPQICIYSSEGFSEMVFPAGHYRLYIDVYVEKTTEQPFKMIRNIIKSINRMINRKASSISEINVPANTGLRIAKCLKSGGFINFDKETGLYYSETEYDAVISEGESFAAADSGNRAWV